MSNNDSKNRGNTSTSSRRTVPGLSPEHDLFIQSTKLKNTLRHLMGEEMITHLGLDYYDSFQSQEHDYVRM